MASSVGVRAPASESAEILLDEARTQMYVELHERLVADRLEAVHLARLPRDNVLLELTREWARRSDLGDLPFRDMGPGDVELRYWGGFGIEGTAGVVLRRENGVWKGWRTRVVTCLLVLPFAVSDTMSARTTARYEEEARRKCPGDRVGAGRIIQAFVLELIPLKTQHIEPAWRAAVAAGAPILPREVGRQGVVDDRYTHIVEVRVGKSYRASVIGCATPPRGPDDYRMQDVAGALARVLPGVVIGCTRVRP